MAEKMKYSDAKALDAKSIDEKVSSTRKQLFELRMQQKTSGIEKPHVKKVLKKNIARMLTAKGSK